MASAKGYGEIKQNGETRQEYGNGDGDGWMSLGIGSEEFRPSLTLTTGQSFRWTERLGVPGEYTGVIGKKVSYQRDSRTFNPR